MCERDQTIAHGWRTEDGQQVALIVDHGAERQSCHRPDVWMIFPVALRERAAGTASASCRRARGGGAEIAFIICFICVRKNAKRIRRAAIQRRLTVVSCAALVKHIVADNDLNRGTWSKVVLAAQRHAGETSFTKESFVRRPHATKRVQVGLLHPLNGKASRRSVWRSGGDRQCYGGLCVAIATDSWRTQL